MSRSSRLVQAFALVWLAGAAAAQDAISPPLKGFAPTNDFALRVDGAPAGARIYYQGEQPAYLVFSESLPGALLLDLRAGMVESVGAGRIVRQKDGSLDVMPNARRRLGPFTLSRGGVAFVHEKRRVEVTAR